MTYEELRARLKEGERLCWMPRSITKFGGDPLLRDLCLVNPKNKRIEKLSREDEQAFGDMNRTAPMTPDGIIHVA